MRKKGSRNKHSKKIDFTCNQCGYTWKDYPSRIVRKKFCSKMCQVRNNIPNLIKRSMGNKWGERRKITDELRRKISIASKGKKRPNIAITKLGNRNPNWRGGITPLNKKIRKSAPFREWRNRVFTRDRYICQICGKKGGVLHPDHIKPFAYFPELRFDVDNGRTLCKKCHEGTDSYGSKAIKNYKSLTKQK